MISLGRAHPERTRLVVGAVLYAVLMLGGALLFALLFLVPPAFAPHAEERYLAMLEGAALAIPALFVYLWVPALVDRYDPEPWWCLLLALLWGAVAACGFSALINTGVSELAAMAVGGKQGAEVGEIVGSVVSAPLVEEAWKGLAVLGAFYFLRREFDGVVDGIIYATFAALGFAATENVIYYSRAALGEILQHKENALAGVFLVRGVLSPWGHPLYTSMTGLGFGIARETTRPALRWLAPIGGYLTAVVLHAVWNGAATFSGSLVLLMLPLWLLFVLAFAGLLVALVVRKGRIIRENLRDEVLMGNLSPWELDLVCSATGRLRAGSALGREFVAAAARLGLCKWHAARAMKGQKRTVSMDFIVPLRQELFRLRGLLMAERAGRRR